MPLGTDNNGIPMQLGMLPAAGEATTVAVSGTAAGVNLPSSARYVYVFSDVQVHVRRVASGAADSAAVTDTPVPSGIPMYFSLPPGEHRLSAIAVSAGTLYVSWGD